MSPALLLAGPTAVGKSQVALFLASQLNGEILSVDSMQVYRGLDIGAAKPSAEERQRIQHHLIDVADLHQPFDAAQFVERARTAASQITARGRLPILCGGTGLYFKAYLEGLGAAPASDPVLRSQLEQTPLPELLRELQEKDPQMFGQIDANNPRRIIRAVEVLRITGKPFSTQRAAWLTQEKPARCLQLVALDREPSELSQRIDTRTDVMFERGLVRETEQLLARGLDQNRTAMQAIGYRQVVEHLRGERSLAETISLVKLRTRQFAKRQRTWFRRQGQWRWIHLEKNETAEEIAARVAALWRQSAVAGL